jgi:dTDP-4-dehydrorhamnose reductase
MKRLLLTGARGYIGRYLEDFFSKKYQVISLDMAPSSQSGGRYQNYCFCDLRDYASLNELMIREEPDIVIHCAGIKDLSACETNPEEAYRINFGGTRNLIKSIIDQSLRSIFLSTDYVFSGERGNYSENDKTEPKTVYGRTKLEAEKVIREKCSNFAICRTSSVYGKGSSFFEFILSSLDAGREVEVYDNAYFSPTCIFNLVQMIDRILEKRVIGIFHTAGSEEISRYMFAKKIARVFGKDESLVRGVHKPEQSPIARNSSLNVERTRSVLGIESWDISKGLEFLKAKMKA